jgi:2-polyprenyl-6-methoxyphenol hydroxylase-like FAD-dependent oxidoreductase
MLPEQVEVVVVGAGPTGLALACTLRKAGVEVVVLDKFAEGAKTSRAVVLHVPRQGIRTFWRVGAVMVGSVDGSAR